MKTRIRGTFIGHEPNLILKLLFVPAHGFNIQQKRRSIRISDGKIL